MSEHREREVWDLGELHQFGLEFNEEYQSLPDSHNMVFDRIYNEPYWFPETGTLKFRPHGLKIDILAFEEYRLEIYALVNVDFHIVYVYGSRPGYHKLD